MFSPNVSLRQVQPEIMDEQRPWAERPSLFPTCRGWAVLSSHATLGNQCLKARGRGGAGDQLAASISQHPRAEQGWRHLTLPKSGMGSGQGGVHSPTQPHTAPQGRWITGQGAWHQAPPQQEIFPSHARLQGAAEQGKGLPWNPQVLGLSSELPLEMGVMTVWHPHGEGRGADSGQDEAAPTPQQCSASGDTSTGQGSAGLAPALLREEGVVGRCQSLSLPPSQKNR